MPEFPPSLVKHVLLEGGTPWDFERFCARHFSEVEGIDYLSTSRSYDLGRDARSVTVLGEGESFVVASLQEEGLPEKAVLDVSKLVNHSARPAKIVICFAGLRSEQARVAVERHVRRAHPRQPLVVMGMDQLLDQIGRHPSTFQSFYEHAIDELRRQLEPADRSSQDSIRLGFRVLLATELDGDAQVLRKNILRGLILQALRSHTPTDPEKLLRAISTSIGATRPVHSSYIESALLELAKEQLIEVGEDGRIRRRTNSMESLTATGVEAATRALLGFGALKRSLATHFGDLLRDRDYSEVWRATKEGLVELFQQYGVEVVEFIYGISDEANSKAKVSPPGNISVGLHRIAISLEHLNLNLKDKELAKLIQIFPTALLDGDTGARHWIANLCLGYVCACSLGLHPDALKRMEVRLQTWDIIPDTHVVLSAIGQGEPDHQATVHLLKQWRAAKGSIVAIEPVMRETLNHATICREIVNRWADSASRRRYRRNSASIPDANVFLRGAKAKYGAEIGPKIVNDYLAQFFSPSGDTSYLAQILFDDFNFTPAREVVLDKQLEKSLLTLIAQRRLDPNSTEGFADTNAKARCAYDAAILAYLAALRVLDRPSKRVSVLLSHANHLRSTAEEFHSRFGFMSVTVDPQCLMFALSLIPGVAFNLKSMEAALFGAAFQHEVWMQEELARKVATRFAQREAERFHTPALRDEVDRSLTQGS